jgi:cytochrome P450
MTTATRALRRRLSSAVMMPAPGPVDDAVLGLLDRFPTRELASPPPDSALRPVPGDFGPPLVGHVPEMMRYGTRYLRRRCERYGPIWWAGGPGGLRTVFVGGPDATQVVLANREDAFSNEAWSTRGAGVFFRRGLLMLSFDEHRFHRRIMQDAFSSERLAGYLNLMVPCARQTVPTWPSDEAFRLYYALKQLTLDVATRAFMDEEIGPEGQRINDAFVASLRGAMAIVMRPLPGSRWRAATNGRARLEDYFQENLPQKRASQGDDLFSVLCHAVTPEGERFSDEDIVNHMIFLMMAAHDTATITSTTATYYLAKHPEWQERARQESLGLGDEALGPESLERLDVLDRVIKESLRLLAPVPVYMRTAVRDTDVLGYHIPARSMVAVTPQVNHFDPDCWSDPDRFDPDRFGPDRHEDRSHTYAWIPFGMGAHKCIGMRFGVQEVKVMLHEMLRTFRWELAGDYEVRWDHSSLPIPSNGLPVRLTRL